MGGETLKVEPTLTASVPITGKGRLRAVQGVLCRSRSKGSVVVVVVVILICTSPFTHMQDGTSPDRAHVLLLGGFYVLVFVFNSQRAVLGCLGPVLGLSWVCLGPILGLSWPV